MISFGKGLIFQNTIELGDDMLLNMNGAYVYLRNVLTQLRDGGYITW